jgi:hypothetical protein
MKIVVKYSYLLFLVGTVSVFGQQVQKMGTNQNTINSAAVLELESTSKGLLLPRMTLDQRERIQNPVAGLVVWCTNCPENKKLNYFNGLNWMQCVNYTVPRAPTAPVATVGNAQASVRFTPPTSDGGSPITSYTVTASPSGQTATGGGTPIVVPGLTVGTSYTFTVVATNAAGSSIASTVSPAVTAITVPDAPTNVIATPYNADSVLLTWEAPVYNGGNTISWYNVNIFDSSSHTRVRNYDSATPSLSIDGFTNCTSYYFTVEAFNNAGSSVASTTSNVVKAMRVPDIPSQLNLTEDNGKITVTYTAPAYNGCSPITSYTVTMSPENYTVTNNGTPVIITGLTNGTTYTFSVVATNAMGNSDPLTASAIPRTVPNAPTLTSVAESDTNVGVSVYFSAPSYDGGSPITSYKATASPGGNTATSTGESISVTGLTVGSTYTFKVIAINEAGESISSNTSRSITVRNNVAICDGSVPTAIVPVTSSVTGKIWMDRNLGASRVAISKNDLYAYGCLYQWGRDNDGHASIKWNSSTSGTPVNGTMMGPVTTTNPGHALFILNNQAAESVDNPNLYDWFANTTNTIDTNANRWQSSDPNNNNPCPITYRVPTQLEFYRELNGYQITDINSAYTNGPFKFTAAGFRNNNGILFFNGTSGRYYTKTTNVGRSFGINITENGPEILDNNSYRVNAMSVRCIKI